MAAFRRRVAELGLGPVKLVRDVAQPVLLPPDLPGAANPRTLPAPAGLPVRSARPQPAVGQERAQEERGERSRVGAFSAGAIARQGGTPQQQRQARPAQPAQTHRAPLGHIVPSGRAVAPVGTGTGSGSGSGSAGFLRCTYMPACPLPPARPLQPTAGASTTLGNPRTPPLTRCSYVATAIVLLLPTAIHWPAATASPEEAEVATGSLIWPR